MFENINAMIKKIKQEKPLVLNITNYVTMDFVANGLLSLGASPVMSKAQQEAADLLKITGAVVINLGTLNKEFIELCEHVCELANAFDKPIILDPVGAGASSYRTQTCEKLLSDYNIAIIRGNASEIMALTGTTLVTKGVDSSARSDQAVASAEALAKQLDTTIVISGETDFVINPYNIAEFSRGSAMMPMITGTGCLLSAVVGAFQAVHKNAFEAASASTLFYSVCGELAAAHAQGPGTFKTHFLDALYSQPLRDHYEN
jgi:hydroxyethylthiazole kinase